LKILVTGGAGFIGTSVVRQLLGDGDGVVNLDKLTYAGSNPPLGALGEGGRYALEVADVADAAAVARIFAQHRPEAVMHLAAETHVDRSIDRPADFIDANIVGTFTMLEAARHHWQSLDPAGRAGFRFHLISTDEVFGSLEEGASADEAARYQPNSPYAASKAAADHLAEGGYAALLVSWVAESEEEPDERLGEWLDGSGCDAWVLSLNAADPLDHAAGWNEHLSADAAAYGAALDEWLAYFDSLGVGWISEGAVLLHRRGGQAHALRVDEVDEDDLEFAGDQIERVFTAQARLAALADDDALADEVAVLAPTVRVEQRLAPGSREADTWLVLDEGTNAEYELDPDVAEVVALFDGDLTLGRAIARVGRAFDLERRELAELRDDSLAEVRDLLELGFAELK